MKCLNEKDEYLSEIIFEDEPSLNEEKKTENSYTKKSSDISIPSSPNKFTFGKI